MTRKKRTQEEQPLTTEVVGAKKKSPKKKKAVEEKPVVVVQEQEASVNEPTTQEDVAENTPEKREYTIDELIDMLGPDIECEDETEVEDTSSPEKEDNGEDIFATLDDWTEDDDEEEFSDEIIDMFDHLKRKDSVTLTLSGWKGISKNMRKLKGNANFILMKSSGYYLLLQRLDCYWQYH